MSKAVATPGQGFFVPGLVERQVILKDSTKLVSTAAANEFVMGAPISLDGNGTDQGKLKSQANNAADAFYGACGTNINDLRGKVSLGETRSVGANAILQGIVTVRKSIFLNAAGSEVTITPFDSSSFGGGFPASTDVGKVVDAILVTAETELNSNVMLKWGVGNGSACGFANVAMILDVREGEECDLLLTNALANLSLSV